MSFGANEEAAPDVVANAASDVREEVGGAEVGETSVGVDGIATAGLTVGTGLIVESGANATDSGHEFGVCFGRNAGDEDGIGVEENGAISLKAVVEAFLGADGDFGVEPEILVENVIGADAGIEAGFFRRRQVGLGGAGVLGGERGASSDGDVNLLSGSKSGQKDYSC